MCLLVACACMHACRYLIQNLTGSDVWYWAEQPTSGKDRGGSQQRVYLPAYALQELKVCKGRGRERERFLWADSSCQ